MPSKYDLDKLLDPYGIESFQKTITRITNPLKEYAAMAGITEQWKSPNAAFDAITKAAMPWNEHAAMTGITEQWKSPNAAFDAITKAAMPWNEHAAMTGITEQWKSPNAAFDAITKAAMPWNEHAAMTGITEQWKSPNAAFDAITKAAMPWNEHAAMTGITEQWKSPNAAFDAITKAAMPWNEQAGITEQWKSPNAAFDAITKAASSIAINKSLGLQADIQRLIAARTLIPDLNNKIFNLNQKLSAIAGLTEQGLNQNNSGSIQNYLDTLEEFNEKYDQDINIDRTTIQTLDLFIHEQESLELTSELKNIGIFDTASGSILLEYSKTLPTEKAANFLNILLCLLMFFYEPVINEYEPIKNHREKLANSLNGIEGKALITKDCDLKYQPGGLKKMSLEKESLVIVYKNKDISDGWSKIKFNKDGQDITGYIQTSELNLLD